MKAPTPTPLIRGEKYRRTHKASVIGILGSEAPHVISKGELFYNQDRWTARFVVEAACAWAKENPGCMPTNLDVEQWARSANRRSAEPRQIVIANTPDKLPLRTALALTGGAYHEAFHTKFSCRRTLTASEVAPIILPRWAKIKDWSKHRNMLQDWSNIVEDIRIERRGREQYDGVYVKLCDLQDFILLQEKKAKTKDKKKAKETLSIVLGVYRDVGLGYNTETQQMRMKEYQEDNKKAVKMVLDGPLSEFLRENIGLALNDDLACLRIAMDIVATLAEMGEDTEDKKAKDGQPGDGRMECPACGAPADKIKVRPKAGGTAGEAIATCTVCGFQQTVKVDKKGKKSSDGKRPQFEGFDEEESGSGSGGSSEEKESASGSEGGEKKGEKKSGGQKTGSKGSGEGESKENDSESAKGAGGYNPDDSELPGEDWSDIAKGALKGKGSGLKDVSSALSESFHDVKEKEQGKTEKGEKVWNPYDLSQDSAKFVSPSGADKSGDTCSADQVLHSVKEETAYLRARLRTVIRSIEMSHTVHGVPKGKGLSSRFLVDSKAAIMGGEMPTRAYYQPDVKIDMSMAVAVVLDESGSMGDLRRDATRIMMALAEPFDALGFPTMAIGFRDGGGIFWSEKEDESHHRKTPVHYDVFKMFHEKFRTVRWRFVNTRATGGTPMSDGIQYALDAISPRNEAHRFIFVVTDGYPNYNHIPVIQWQLRAAKEAGIHILGVGMGEQAAYVKQMFPDHVYSNDMEEFPRKLLAKLNALVDVRAWKRGRRVRKRR